MSIAAIDGVIDAQAALIAALDTGRAEAIEGAVAVLTAALAQVRGEGAWAASASSVDRVGHALRQTEAARTRVNYLADRTRARLARVALARDGGTSGTYDARGKQRFRLMSR